MYVKEIVIGYVLGVFGGIGVGLLLGMTCCSHHSCDCDTKCCPAPIAVSSPKVGAEAPKLSK